MFGLTWVKPLGILLVVLGIAGAGAYANGVRWEGKYDKLAAEFSTFKGGVAALGEAAAKAAAEKAANDAKLKAKADNENKRAVSDLRATVARLRLEADRARGSYVPAAPTGAARPDLACFDRAALESALRELVAEVRGFVDEGAEATVNLNAAKLWNTQRENGK